MRRSQLDEVAERYRLSPQGSARLLDLAVARPTPAERRQMLERSLFYCGVLSGLFGVGFFIAANWESFGVTSRFALVETLLALAALTASVPRLPQTRRRYLLLAAFYLTGVLLALFGQTYQTGADTYELFMTWAFLGLPFVIAARSPDLAVSWLLVQNLAFALYAGLEPRGGPFFTFSSIARLEQVEVLLLAGLANLLFFWLGSSQRLHFLRPWAPRTAASLGLSLASWAGVLSLIEVRARTATRFGLDLLIVAALLSLYFVVARHHKKDVFPVAAVFGSLIVLSTTALVRVDVELGAHSFFGIAGWVIASSAVSSKLLLRWHKAAEENTAEEDAAEETP